MAIPIYGLIAMDCGVTVNLLRAFHMDVFLKGGIIFDS